MRGTGVIEQEMMRKQKAKREEMKREVEIVDGNRMAKLYKKRGSGGGHGKNKNRKHEKKWVCLDLSFSFMYLPILISVEGVGNRNHSRFYTYGRTSSYWRKR